MNRGNDMDNQIIKKSVFLQNEWTFLIQEEN